MCWMLSSCCRIGSSSSSAIPFRALPLQVANPDHHDRQLVRVRVHLDPVELARVHPRLERHPMRPGERDHFLLQRLQQRQRHVEEVAAPAGRVEHPRRADLLEERLDRLPQPAPFRLRLPARPPRLLHRAKRRFLHALPLPPQRRHQHRLHHHLDVRPGRVVRAQLRPRGRVQHPLEQRPEDRRLHVRPVQPVEPFEQRDLSAE